MRVNNARRTLAGRIAAPAGAAATLLLSALLAIPAYAATGQPRAVTANSMPAINYSGGMNHLHDAHSGKLLAAATAADALQVPHAAYHRVGPPASDVPAQGAAYTIVNDFSGLCLDDYQFSTSDDTHIVQHTCDGYTNQLWVFVTGPTLGTYYIKNVFSGKCLDDYQFSTSDGAPIVQHWCDGYTNQQWQLLAYNGYPGIFVTNVFSGKVLDDWAFSMTKNIIRQYHWDGYTNQQWYLN